MSVPTHAPRTISLQRALLGTIALALVGGVVPAALVLDRQLAAALETRARADLASAPRIVVDRAGSSSDAMMMHAKDFAHVSAISAALASGDREEVQRLSEAARSALGGEPIVVGPDGTAWIGTSSALALTPLVTRTRRGEMPVATLRDGAALRDVALAPVEFANRWVGAVGVSAPLDASHAAALAGLTRAGVVLLDASPPSTDAMTTAAGLTPSTLVVSTLDAELTAALMRQWTQSTAAATTPASESVRDVRAGASHLIVASAMLRNTYTVLLVRNLDEELAVLPQLRRIALASAVAALLAALIVGLVLATRIAQPVSAVALAADALARGDFDVSLAIEPAGSVTVREVVRVQTAFIAMRDTLSQRLQALGDANSALADRNAKLTALQADLVQRERLAATGRLVVELAHEIRNPVASLRNCLELIRRRVTHDEEAREFTELAIDELLRMHELAEQMLDLDGSRSHAAATNDIEHACDAARVVQQMLTLFTAGDASRLPSVSALDIHALSDAPTLSTMVAIDKDALKQLLHNLVQNAREAVDGQADGNVVIELQHEEDWLTIVVRDNGPGIPAHVLPHIFDPFFTTKSAMRGVGLGLFIAEGMVRASGGRIDVTSNSVTTSVEARGTTFRVRLPRQQAAVPVNT